MAGFVAIPNAKDNGDREQQTKKPESRNYTDRGQCSSGVHHIMQQGHGNKPTSQVPNRGHQSVQGTKMGGSTSSTRGKNGLVEHCSTTKMTKSGALATTPAQTTTGWGSYKIPKASSSKQTRNNINKSDNSRKRGMTDGDGEPCGVKKSRSSSTPSVSSSSNTGTKESSSQMPNLSGLGYLMQNYSTEDDDDDEDDDDMPKEKEPVQDVFGGVWQVMEPAKPSKSTSDGGVVNATTPWRTKPSAKSRSKSSVEATDSSAASSSMNVSAGVVKPSAKGKAKARSKSSVEATDSSAVSSSVNVSLGVIKPSAKEKPQEKTRSKSSGGATDSSVASSSKEKARTKSSGATDSSTASSSGIFSSGVGAFLNALKSQKTPSYPTPRPSLRTTATVSSPGGIAGGILKTPGGTGSGSSNQINFWSTRKPVRTYSDKSNKKLLPSGNNQSLYPSRLVEEGEIVPEDKPGQTKEAWVKKSKQTQQQPTLSGQSTSAADHCGDVKDGEQKSITNTKNGKATSKTRPVATVAPISSRTRGGSIQDDVLGDAGNEEVEGEGDENVWEQQDIVLLSIKCIGPISNKQLANCINGEYKLLLNFLHNLGNV